MRSKVCRACGYADDFKLITTQPVNQSDLEAIESCCVQNEMKLNEKILYFTCKTELQTSFKTKFNFLQTKLPGLSWKANGQKLCQKIAKALEQNLMLM